MIQASGAKTSVGNRELKAALGDEYLRTYQSECEYLKARQDDYDYGREKLRNYIDLLRIADFNDQAVDRASQLGWQRKSTAMTRDGGYERAIERLQELIEADPSLTRFFDKDYDFETWHGNNGLCFDTVPRPVFHKRKVHGYAEFPGLPTLKELKISALQQAIDQPVTSTQLIEEYDSKALLEQNMKNLNSLLKCIHR